MPSKVVDLGPCEKQIIATVSDEQIKTALERSYGELRKQVSLPGFRPGKVPRGVLEKRFGDHVRHEVYHDLVRDAIEAALREHKLDAVADPKIQHESDHDAHVLPESGSFDVTFEVEVKAPFELPPYTGLPVTRSLVRVPPEKVEEFLRRAAAKSAEWLPVDDTETTWREGLAISGFLTLKVGDELVEDDEPVFFQPEDGVIERIPIDGLVDLVKGAGIDSEIPISCEVPTHHRAENLRGQTAHGSLSIEGFKKRGEVELTDEWAQSMGAENLAAYREEIQARVDGRNQELADRTVVEQILDMILANVDIPLAKSPTERMLQNRLLQQAERLVRGQGMSEEAAWTAVQSEKDQIRSRIERDTRAWLLIEQIAQKEKIYVLEDEVDESFTALAQQFGVKPSLVRRHYEENDMMEGLRTEILESKVCTFLREKAQITDEWVEADSASPQAAEGAEEA